MTFCDLEIFCGTFFFIYWDLSRPFVGLLRTFYGTYRDFLNFFWSLGLVGLHFFCVYGHYVTSDLHLGPDWSPGVTRLIHNRNHLYSYGSS